MDKELIKTMVWDLYNQAQYLEDVPDECFDGWEEAQLYDYKEATQEEKDLAIKMFIEDAVDPDDDDNMNEYLKDK